MSEAENPTPPPPPQEPPPPPAGSDGSGSGGDSSGSSGNRGLMIALSYLGILALVPFLVEKDDKEVQWHAKHGLILFGVWLVLFFLLSILGTVPAVGCLTLFVVPILGLLALVIHIICIVKGVNGERFLIPGISQYADRF